MHFWIDKRSHACGFGRARVAASLSGTGLGFGHYPRRMGITKSVDLRPIVHRSHQNHHHDQNQSQSQSHSHSQSTSGRNQRALSSQSVHHVQPQQRSQPTACNSQQQTTSGQHSNQPLSSRHLNTQHSALSMGECTNQTAVLEAPRDDNTIENLEQVRSILENSSTAINEAPLLPTHLKYGMCASLALTIIFVAAFQGSNLEAASIGACAISLFTVGFTFSYFYYPRNIPMTPSMTGHFVEPLSVNEQMHLQPMNPPETSITIERAVGPPPPYHIAILLPEKSEEIDEESPPPSYDKLEI